MLTEEQKQAKIILGKSFTDLVKRKERNHITIEETQYDIVYVTCLQLLEYWLISAKNATEIGSTFLFDKEQDMIRFVKNFTEAAKTMFPGYADESCANALELSRYLLSHNDFGSLLKNYFLTQHGYTIPSDLLDFASSFSET